MEIGQVRGLAAEAVALRGELGQRAGDVDEVFGPITQPRRMRSMSSLKTGGGSAPTVEDSHPPDYIGALLGLASRV